MGTAVADDPQLTVRGEAAALTSGRQPLRVVLDPQVSAPPRYSYLMNGTGRRVSPSQYASFSVEYYLYLPPSGGPFRYLHRLKIDTA